MCCYSKWYRKPPSDRMMRSLYPHPRECTYLCVFVLRCYFLRLFGVIIIMITVTGTVTRVPKVCINRAPMSFFDHIQPFGDRFFPGGFDIGASFWWSADARILFSCRGSKFLEFCGPSPWAGKHNSRTNRSSTTSLVDGAKNLIFRGMESSWSLN